MGFSGTGKGGESIWGGKFEDELRDLLKVCMAELVNLEVSPASSYCTASFLQDGEMDILKPLPTTMHAPMTFFMLY